MRLKAWRERKADAQGDVPDTPEPTLDDCAADIERKRLFEIIEELVIWENSTNEEVLERAGKPLGVVADAMEIDEREGDQSGAAMPSSSVFNSPL